MMVIITPIIITSINASVLCDTNYIGISYNQTDTITRTIHCTNQLNQSVNLTKSGDTQYFSINSNSFGPNEGKDITITFDSNAPINLYTGQLIFSDSSPLIQLFFNVKEKISFQNNGVIVFPTAKVVSILNGQTKNQNIQVILPSNYNDYIDIQSITFNPDIDLVQTSDLDLGRLNPGQTLNIPLIINKDASSSIQIGNYQTIMNILATNSQGVINLPPVNIQVSVSASTNPLTNSSLVRPSCILSPTTITLNGTATLTCTNVLNNLDVSPQYNDFITGIDAQLVAGVYKYSFKVNKIGSSSLVTQFNYLNSPLFTPDIESFSVLPTGLNTGGNLLDVVFFQDGVRLNKSNLGIGETSFTVIDSASGNIITSYQAYLNGQLLNNTKLNIEVDKTLDFRVSSMGYNDLNIPNLSANLIPLSFSIIPNKEFYETGDSINFNCSVENVTYLVDNIKIPGSYYTFTSASNHTITAVKDGYLSSNITVQVIPSTTISGCSPEYSEWAKGKKVICSLNKNATWSVLNNGKNLASGNSNQLDFTITESGPLSITANSKQIYSTTIDDSNIFLKYWWVIAIIVIIIVIFLFIAGSRNKNSEPMAYG